MASVSGNVRLIDTKCRICMFPKQNLSSLFNRGLSMKVMKLAEIKMYEGDGLPSTICLDCELEVNRCVNFIGQIQRADVKLRQMLQRESELPEVYKRVQELGKEEHEMEEREHYMEEREEEMEEREQEASTSQIDIEEFNVKQEITTMDHYLDEGTDPKRESDSDNHFEDESLPLQDESLALQDESLALQPFTNNYQPEDERVLNPLNHVDVMEDGNRPESMEVHHDPLGQEEPLIEPQKIESFPFVDPLTFMKQEEGVSMDIDKNNPEPCASSSTVKRTIPANSFPGWSATPQDQDKEKFGSKVQNYLITNQTQQLSTKLAGGKPPKSRISIKKVAKPNSFSFDTNNQTLIKRLSKESLVKSRLQKYKEQLKRGEDNGDFYCPACRLDCGTAEFLKEHKERTGVFICRICTEELTSHVELESHFMNHFSFQCSVCEDVFVGRLELKSHEAEKHADKCLFKCEICDKSFLKKKTYRDHKYYYHNHKVCTAEEISQCEVCQQTFNNSRLLKSHCLAVHIPYEYMECKYCQKLLLGPQKMKLHIKMIHVDSEDNRPAACNSCGKVFKRLSILIAHQEKLHKITECLCELCGKSIKNKHEMRLHLSKEHSQSGTFACKYCSKQFVKYSLLRQHHSREHWVRKPPTPVFCEICGKYFKSPQILKNHKKIHSDERPFKCEICSATFRQDPALRTHRRVHSDVGVYNCVKCGMDFKWRQTFEKHVKKCKSEEVDDPTEITT